MVNFFSNWRRPKSRSPQTPKYTQLNDSVYRLYPAGDDPFVPTVDIVFFHGLQRSNSKDAYWKTWRSRKQPGQEPVIWPEAWLGPSIDRAPRILSISYDSRALRDGRGSGALDTSLITENLIFDLIDAGVGQNCPVVLVGHSLGGIIIKHVLLGCLEMKERGKLYPQLQNFVQNCKGVFYYSSPHGGSALADWIIRLVPVLKWVPVIDFNVPLLSVLKRLTTKTAVFNREFDMSKHNLGDGGLRTRAIGESLPTKILMFKLRVVKLASAMQNVDGGFYTAPHADHYDVCKPKNNMTDPIFRYLWSFIADLLNNRAIPAAGDRVLGADINQDGAITDIPESTTQPRILERPRSIQMVNESVWQLYAPSTAPEVEVVFFHGLQRSHYEEAFWKCWLSRDGTQVWPKDWLSEKFPRARILSISYLSIVESYPGWADQSILAENLIQDLIDARVGQNCPVVLVGHSVGGTIIRKTLVQCFRKKLFLDGGNYPREMYRLQTFLGNCRGVFYYSTPHHGSRLGDLANRIPRTTDPTIILLKTLAQTLSTPLLRVNEEFRQWRGTGRIRTGSIVEDLPTKLTGMKLIVAVEASVRHDSDFSRTVMADHFDVCKPESKEDYIFAGLCDFVGDIVEHNVPSDSLQQSLSSASTSAPPP